MDKETNSIISQIDKILNTENLDEKTRRQLESMKQSLEDVNEEAIDVQSLSEGLDQLDKIYADILDKEEFDWSSILNNEGFTKAFGAYTEEELYQTMAEIPIEKRDKNVDTLDTRLDIINSKRDNINAVIVDPKKYASTKKTLKTSKSNVKKSIKTKAQRNASGLTPTEISTIKDQMKKGQTIPAKILDKITDGNLYETCKQYNDATTASISRPCVQQDSQSRSTIPCLIRF